MWTWKDTSRDIQKLEYEVSSAQSADGSQRWHALEHIFINGGCVRSSCFFMYQDGL